MPTDKASLITENAFEEIDAGAWSTVRAIVLNDKIKFPSFFVIFSLMFFHKNDETRSRLEASWIEALMYYIDTISQKQQALSNLMHVHSVEEGESFYVQQ